MMNIQDLIGQVVASMRTDVDGPPYYIYGHRNEIAARLLKKEGSTVSKYKKYPLIILAMDIPGTYEDLVSWPLNIAIATRTTVDLNVEQRMEQKFKPILYPLRDQFIQAIADSGLFLWEGDPSAPKYVAVDRPKWGFWTSEGTLQQYLPDPLDVVEILNLKLNKEIC